jgi:nucleotide-binding universal stress UspA family protein
MKILLAVDGSKHSLTVVQFLIEHVSEYRERPAVELVTVHLPVPQVPGLGTVVGKAGVQRYYREEGEERLAPAKKKLDAAGVPYQAHILIGQPAEALLKHAKDTRCDMILIGSHGMSELGKALLGSTAGKVLHSATIPVLLVR